MGFYTNPSTSAANGQVVYTTSVQTASFTAAANVIYQVSASSAAVTVTLPTSAAYQSLIIRRTDTSINTMTVTGTINGASNTSMSLTRQYQSKQLYADGSGGWLVVAGDVDLSVITSSTSSTGLLSAAGTAKLTVGTTAPASPATGDIWIDTN